MNKPWLWTVTGVVLVLPWPARPAAAQPATADRRPPLQLRLYASLVAGVSERRAQAATKPLIDLVSANVDYPVESGIEKGTGPEGVLAFGKKLDDGVVHVGTVWGLEYGWIRQKYPKIKPMAIAANGNRAPWRSQLMVRRQDNPPSLAPLKGKKLAEFKYMSLMDRLILDDMLVQAKQDPRDFFALQVPRASVKEALLAVKNGQADCVMVNVADFTREANNQPKVAQALMAVKVSQPYPGGVLVGRVDRVEHLQRGLWGKVQTELLRCRDTAEGAMLADFWRFDLLERPDDKYLEQVDEAARKFPIERLRKLRSTGHGN